MQNDDEKVELTRAAGNLRRGKPKDATPAGDNANPLTGLAGTLRGVLRQNDPLSRLRQVGQADPTDAEAQFLLGETLLDRGQLDEATASYERAVMLRPDHLRAWLGLVHLRHFRIRDPAQAAFQRAIDSDADDSDKAAAHFALGKAHDDAGEPARAFAHYRAANEMLAARHRERGDVFEAAAERERLARARADYPLAFFAERPGFGIADERPVLIVGLSRTGKTLLQQMLAAHPDIAVAGDLSLKFGAGEARLLHGLSQELDRPLGELDAEAVAAWARRYLDNLVARSRPEALRILDAKLHNVRYLGFAALLCPTARVIWCRREQRDSILANYFRSLGPKVPQATDLEACARYLRCHEGWMEHWRAVLPLPILEVKYEEFVTDPATVLRQVVDFLGLPWDDACLRLNAPRLDTIGPGDSLPVPTRLVPTHIGFSRRYASFLGPIKAALAEPV